MEKRHLQIMLREMGIPYPQDATESALAEILKRENHAQWMKWSRSRGVKKKRPERKPAEPRRTGPHPTGRPPSTASIKRPIQRVGGHAGETRKEPPRPLTAETDAPARATGICDLCEKPVHESGELIPFAFSEKPGTRHTVALCPECTEKVKGEISGKDIRALKRKARTRVNSDLQISYGRVKNSWGYKPGSED